jgi:hypothetical protein
MAYTTIDNPFKYFNTKLYTGTGASHNVTGVGFQPDWVWFKKRSSSGSHYLVDVVRGTTKGLASNNTDADVTTTDDVQSFDSDGFTLGASGNNYTNQSSATYASWNWKAGGSASSNSDGSITSSVSANTTAGFSIVSYTGTGANATVGHGLGTNMDFAIFKLRSGSSAWLVYHKSLGATKAIYLNETGAVGTNSSGFNDTEPTSSVFSLGNGATANTSGGTQIAYCFAEKKGFSKFGSYTGNGNADGTFIYTGFRPALVIGKKSSASGNSWWIMDNKRPGYNVIGNYLSPNTSSAESTGSSNLDFTSTGFKIRRTGGFINDSSATYIYTAFAEAPFVTAGTKAAGTAR